MSWLSRIVNGLRALAGGRRVDRELDDELRAYLESAADRQMAAGMSREEAERAARVEMGSLSAVKERVADVGWESIVEALWRDVGYALRALRRSPVATAAAVLVLALGIGVNTALFSLIDAAVLRNMDVREPERLVRFGSLFDPGSNMIRDYWGRIYRVPGTALIGGASISYNAYEALRERGGTLSGVFAFAPIGQVTMAVGDTSERAIAHVVSGSYFATLGVPARHGRTIVESDDAPAAPTVVVLSDGYWRRRFGSDTSIVGRPTLVNNVPAIIIGVAPPGFHGAMGLISPPPDLFLPLVAERSVSSDRLLDRRWAMWLRVMGRMRPGVTPEQVARELEVAYQGVVAEDWLTSFQDASLTTPAETPSPPRLRVRPGGQGVQEMEGEMAGLQRALVVLSVVFGLVLAVVCLNIANLLVARGAARRQEIALRLSIGASRGRIVRQLLTESLVLAAIGGAVGLVVAFWGRQAFPLVVPSGIAIFDLRIDWRVVAFAGGLSLVSAVLFGLTPALRATRPDVGADLEDRGPQGTPPNRRTTRALVTVQVALSLTLLVCAGVFVQTLRVMAERDLGFDQQKLLLLDVDLRDLSYEDERSVRLYDELVEAIGALPGVAAVTSSSMPLMANGWAGARIYLDGAADASESRNIPRLTIRDNFLRTMGVRIAEGRDFQVDDREGAPTVALINETLAAQLFPDHHALGERFGFAPGAASREVEIVGIVRDVGGVGSESLPYLYLPERQSDLGGRTIHVRTDVEPLSIATGVREAVRQVDARIAVSNLRTQAQQTQELFATERVLAWTSGAFGGVVLLLVGIGLYGVLSFLVVQRTREVGVRIALGADRARVVGGVLREAAWPVGVGSLAGLAGGLVSARLARRLLEGLAPADPLSVAVAVTLMMATAALAAYLPARRAASIDPIEALRHQ